MSFDHRSYGGKQWMPTPQFFLEKDKSFFIVVFSWGNQRVAQKVIEQVKTFISLMLEDREMTSPFETLSCLHPYGNYIRTSLMLVNDALFYEENNEEYSEGVEIFVLLKNQSTIYWSQIGNFNIFLNRSSLPLQTLEVSSDLSSEFSLNSKEAFLPLPGRFLGTDSTSNFSIKEFRYQKNDQIIFLTRSFIPEKIFSLSKEKRNKEKITEICFSDHKDLPFWLGFLDF